MTTSPSRSVELRWGRGSWTRDSRLVVSTLLDVSLELGEQMLDFLEVDRTTRSVVAHRCGATALEYGWVGKGRRVHMNFHVRAIKRATKSSDPVVYSDCWAHENIHIARMRHFPCLGPTELIATEGLAYYGTHLALSQHVDPQDYPPSDTLRVVTSDRSSTCDTVTERVLRNTDAIDLREEYWLVPQRGLPLPPIACAGISRVMRLAGQGLSFQDMMTMPAEDILWGGHA